MAWLCRRSKPKLIGDFPLEKTLGIDLTKDYHCKFNEFVIKEQYSCEDIDLLST